MNGYRLLIRDAQGKDTGEQGTGWFLRPNLVVTAFHVVGNKSLRKWVQSAPGRERDTFWLSGLPADKQVQLSPGCFDASSDVALLTCAPAERVKASALTVVAERGDGWWADGFPGSGEGKVRRLTGRITADRGDLLELLIDQGTEVTWGGISGTAIFTGEGVAGVITDEVRGANTLEAASFRVVARLVAALDAIKRETGLLKRLQIDWNGDIQDLWTKLTSLIEIPKLFELLREPLGTRLAIRVVAGIDAGPNEDARRARLGSTYGVAISQEEKSLYVGNIQGFGIHRIRTDRVPELLAKEVLRPAQLVVDLMAENLYVSSLSLHVIQKVVISNGETEIIAGNGVEGFAGDGGPALKASFRWPKGVAVSPVGNTLYVADTGNHRIRRVLFLNGESRVETIAGNGTVGYSGDRGQAQAAQLNAPTFIGLDADGLRNLWPSYLFFSDTGNHCIRKIRLHDGEITTVVGTGQASFSEDGTAGVNAAIHTPMGLAMTPQGLCFAEAGNRRVRLLREDGILTTIAGNGEFGFSGDCRDARFAELWYPTGLCVNPYSGLLYVADCKQIKVLGQSNWI